ncbi:Fic family protein [Curtobacterium flaccumfaciens]|uniref:Fic family protein n=1 Tax=Curtobacterium flaccumfaciens TaxID=2035 RepID=UPI001600CFD6|nr:Fic family protein [Curtobacterium flaccumfaciens]MBB1195860.1 hypothetical protein [Curtobacterium flaccumfaciens]
MAVLFAEDFPSQPTRARRVRAGEVRQLARGIWTDDARATDEGVVQQHWREIVAHVMPGAVITYRSGFTMLPSDGLLFVSHPRQAPLELPGLTVIPDGNASPSQADDVPQAVRRGQLFAASRIRALIDNAEQRGRPGKIRRRLTRDELHDQVVRIVTSSTPAMVDRLLDEVDARANSVAAGDIRAFVDAARGRIHTLRSGSRAMQAAQRGETYDTARAALFKTVVEALDRAAPVDRPVLDARRAALVPFYEAYFSNYIEGSTLTINEAESVVFDEADVGKPEDSHDIRATWEVVTDLHEMTRRFADADEFMDALRDRHRAMMSAHPRAKPGEWKTQRNQAGATVFVDPEHVVGTLRAGWEEGQALTDPFKRAAYFMFLVTEVHPFADGNGRSARVAMNGELIPDGMHRIVVPTVARIDYMSALARTTAGNGPEGLLRVLSHLQHWVANGSFETLERGDRYLRATNALWDSGIAERSGIQLRVPKIEEIFEEVDVPFPDAAARDDETLSLLDQAIDVARRPVDGAAQ